MDADKLSPEQVIILAMLRSRQTEDALEEERVAPFVTRRRRRKFKCPTEPMRFKEATEYAFAWWEADRDSCDKECRIPLLDRWCAVCGLPQLLTSSGETCGNGHGGVDSLEAKPPAHKWVDDPDDPAGHRCAVCLTTDLAPNAAWSCMGVAK